jgi:hypothetical protein
MDMGVILEGSASGVEDAEESGEITADVFFIQSEFFDGFGGSLEQASVSCPLVLTDETAQTLWDGKGEHEMVAGELAFHTFFQPLSALLILTGGAMAVSTGAMDPMELAALLALIEGDPTSLGATGEDGIDDLAVCIGHSLGKAFQILGAERSEDLINCGHGLSPP